MVERASIAPQELFNDPCPSLVIPSIVTISVLVRPGACSIVCVSVFLFERIDA